MNKIRLALAVGAGYVLGTRAGRERYEQIRQQAQGLLERPELRPVKERLDKVMSQRQPAPYPESTSAAPADGRLSSTVSAAPKTAVPTTQVPPSSR